MYVTRIFLATIFLSCTHQQRHTAENEADVTSKQYVISVNGLILREKPSADSQKILVIPFGEAIATTQTDITRTTVGSKSGSWVKTEYQGEKGFVFDAYIHNDIGHWLSGKRFSYGSECKGITYSEFSREVTFLADRRYEILSKYAYSFECNLDRTVVGTYEISGPKLLLSPLKVDNRIYGSKNCPKKPRIQEEEQYARYDGGRYTWQNCNGKLSFRESKSANNSFVEVH